MITIKRLSAWKYDTSASGGVAVGIVALEGGALYFLDPNGLSRKFRSGGLGAGLSWGLKIPKMPKIQIKGKSAGGVAAPASFPSRGALLVTNRCPGGDLVKSDIQGACAFLDGGIGVVGGVYGGVMLLGLNTFSVLAAVSNPSLSVVLWPVALESAQAILAFGGANLGIQAGAG